MEDGAAGSYPVDILEDDPEGHQAAALAYYATLGQGARPATEVFSLPTGEQVKLDASSVCFCSLHRDEPRPQMLVLVNPQDTKTVVAVYIQGSWWPTEDVLRTSDPAREGLVQVQSFGERIVLFILNVVIFGRLERKLDDDDMFFLPHSAKEQAKILWRDGAAAGFYTTKTKGSLCGDGTGACYLLPVFDTVFVRRRHRRQGLGVAMLQDFCETFREDEALGISWPVSPAMYQVCRKFLCARPEERGRLWEVEPPGAWGQRASIWLKVQLQQSRLPNYLRLISKAGESVCELFELGGEVTFRKLQLYSCSSLFGTARPGLAKEDVSSHGRNSRDEGAAEPPDGESSKELISAEEPGRTKDDGACGVQEVRGAELDGQDAERTAVAAGLAGGSWPKHVRPSS